MEPMRPSDLIPEQDRAKSLRRLDSTLLKHPLPLRVCASVLGLILTCTAGVRVAPAQTTGVVGAPVVEGQAAVQDVTGKGQQSSVTQTGVGSKDASGKQQAMPGGKDNGSSSKPAGAADEAASTSKLRLAPTAPAVPPPNLPKSRPVIGLALGGGAAVALSEVGTLQWLDEHRVPVDVIAGTSMGSILAALYSTGKTPEQMKHILTGENVNRIFRIGAGFEDLNYRRREEGREIPNAVNIGLKHGVSLRNSLLTDTGLNGILDREFLNYNDQTDFNDLPIPFRCQATDLNDAKTVTFARGSLPDAVRASASIPGVFRPFEMAGHEYVDGAILENLPTPDVKAMNADVIIAVSLPLEPVSQGELGSILGVLQRAFAVGIEANEAQERKLANVVIMPEVKGFTANSYLKMDELAARGYAAAEAHKAELLPYSLSEDAYKAYVAARRSRERPPAGTVLHIRIKAPNPGVQEYAERIFAPLVNQPVDTVKVEALLADIRSDGRYNADYTVGYDGVESNRPILLVSVNDKNTGPPFLDVGANIAAQTGGVTRATLSSILLWQDLGGYGSGLRANFDVGFLTRIQGEYLYRLNPFSGFFIAPRANLSREPFYIYQGNYRISERQSEFGGFAVDGGWTDNKMKEFRLGWSLQNVQWFSTTGSDDLPNYAGNSQTVRAKFVYDSQNQALVPRGGIRSETTVGYLYDAVGSPSAPQFQSQFDYAHDLHLGKGKFKNDLFLVDAEGGSMFNRDVAQPFRFTLGGPLRVSSLAIDQLRGTDYFLFTPGYLHRLATLPAPLGQSIYFGGAYEIGQMRAPDMSTITRQDVIFGLIAETPLGVITIAPAIGTDGQHKFVFTLGRVFSTPDSLR